MTIIRIIIFLIVCQVFLVENVISAELWLDANRVFVGSGEQVVVDVVLTSDQSINAIEGEIIYPEQILSVSNITDGGSMINFWIQKPDFSTPGRVSFSGITPGGIKGAQSKIFSIVFDTHSLGAANLRVDNIVALKDEGGEVSLLKGGVRVTVNQGDSNNAGEITVDNEPPEYFTPIVSSDQNLFDGKKFLVFSTQDKKSGISRYEIREGWLAWYKEAESPYLIRNQKMNGPIWVRAIDNAGNIRLVEVGNYDRPNWQLFTLIAILISLLFTGMYIIKKWQKSILS